MNLPMSCSRPAVWIRSSSGTEQADTRDLAGVPRDGRQWRAVIASRIDSVCSTVVSRPTWSEASCGAPAELLAALVACDVGSQQVLEDEQDDGEQPDGADARAP